jgi:RNA-binding protein
MHENPPIPNLTGQQKRRLRSLGQSLPTGVVIGKAGPTPAVLREIDLRLEHAELLKVRFTAGAGTQRKETAQKLAQKTRSALAGVVGRTALLYKPNPQLDPENRIRYPE